MADLQPLGDALAGAFGHPVNRPQLNAYVANSQAINGLRSAQTEEAFGNASKAQQEIAARSALKGSLTSMIGDPNKADAISNILIGQMGNAQQAGAFLNDVQQNQNRAKLGDVSLLGSPEQTAAQQAIQGKVAEPVALPNNFTTLAGAPAPNMQQSPQGVAQTAQTKALTAEDIARAEEAHARAKTASSPVAGLDPDTVNDGAMVVMADPTKMSQYAGFGQSGQNNKNAINNRIAHVLTSAGMTPEDMIRQRAISKANVGSAAQAAKQAETLDAFTPLVRSNGDRITQLLDQIGDDGANMPIVAGLQRSLGRNLGDDDLAELHSVFTTYQNEIARLLAAGPSMNGVISDKARGEIQNMAPENMTAGQARRVINRINTEISIRRHGVQSAMDNATGAQLPVTSIGGPGGAAPPLGGTPPAAAPGAGGAISLDDYLKKHGF
jgi:hypothetical protein